MLTPAFEAQYVPTGRLALIISDEINDMLIIEPPVPASNHDPANFLTSIKGSLEVHIHDQVIV